MESHLAALNVQSTRAKRILPTTVIFSVQPTFGITSNALFEAVPNQLLKVRCVLTHSTREWSPYEKPAMMHPSNFRSACSGCMFPTQMIQCCPITQPPTTMMLRMTWKGTWSGLNSKEKLLRMCACLMRQTLVELVRKMCPKRIKLQVYFLLLLQDSGLHVLVSASI